LPCVGVGFAQVVTPPNAVPEQIDGKDYAGRPWPRSKFPLRRFPRTSSSSSRMSKTSISTGLICGPKIAPSLASDAEWLKAHPDVLVTLAGEADERGDIVCNVALSDRRAIATRDALVQLGVSPERILFATGWGKLYPICTESEESCWSQNRRTHIEPWQPVPTQPTHVGSRSQHCR
jgi:hypothetical protein